jgi:thiol reductant ABC exporter CydD subunit
VRGIDPRLLRRAREARVALAADAVLGSAAALLVLAQAVLLARVAAESFAGAPLDRLVTPLALLVAVVAARALAVFGFEAVGRRAASGILSKLRLELVEHRVAHSPAALDGVESADLATVAVGGVDALEATFARYLPQTILATVIPVAVLVLVASIDPLSAGVMLLTLPLVPVFMWLLGRYTEQRARERWQALTLLSTHFLDVVRGLPTLRAFNRAAAQAESVSRVTDRYRATTMRTLRIAFLSGSVLELAATIGIALVAVTIGIRLDHGSLALQTGLTVLILAPELYAPIRNLAAQWHAGADGLAVSKRLLDMIETPPTVHSGATAPPDLRHAPVALERVWFEYPARPGAVLAGLDLELNPGEAVALVGPSGAGKSTVAALLLRLVEPTSGRVVAGGVDLAECDPDAWHRQIAWVPQRPTLLRGTIAHNIRLGSPGSPDEHVRQASRLAGADAFVQALPSGYATVVGDGGRQLSAGERQRIALARAFLRDAPLVLLDEPTADLDPANAELVAEAIDRLAGGRTLLLITHRLELAARTDRVVVLDRGRILGPTAIEAA